MSTATAGSDPDPFLQRPEGCFPEFPVSAGRFPADEGGVPSTHFALPSVGGKIPPSHFRLPSGAGLFKRHPSEPAEAACPFPVLAGIFQNDRDILKP